MADALFTASSFNACLRDADDVAMANLAPIVNTRGPLHAHQRGVVRRTHFHAMATDAYELGPWVVRSTLEADDLTHGDRSVPVADGIATADEAGDVWTIALVNRHPDQPLTAAFHLGHTPAAGTHAGTVLSADSPEAFNSIEHPNRVAPAATEVTFSDGSTTLPPCSLTIVGVTRGGK